MDLNEAIKLAIDGEGILFIGSGFSIGANNINGEKIKSTGELRNTLIKAIGDPSNELNSLSLENIAELYLNKNNEDQLIKILKNEFTVSSISSYHKVIANINWKNIYTTNYDNVFERASSEVNKQITPITLSDKSVDFPALKKLCIHFNGYIERLNRKTLQKEFKLCESSYLTETILQSEWADLFIKDLKVAQVVFFIGYSMYDLDIKRILYISEEFKNKSIIINNDHNTSIKSLLSKFGKIETLSVQELANKTSDLQRTYVPTVKTKPYFHSFMEITRPSINNLLKIRDRDIFSLLCYGDVNLDIMLNSIIDTKYRYYVNRVAVDDAVESLKHNFKNIVFHSDLGNGKSLAIEAFKLKTILLGYNVFVYESDYDNIETEIDYICNLKTNTIIIIENYEKALATIESIQKYRPRNLILLFTTRTILHDTHYEKLQNILSDQNVIEYDLNKLCEQEINSIINIMDTYGLWGEKTNFSKESKIKYIKEDLKSELQYILIDIIKSKYIHNKIKSIIDALNNNQSYYRIVIMIFIMNTINDRYGIDVIMSLLDTIDPNSADFRNDMLVKSLIDVSRNSIKAKSSVLSKYILKNIANGETIVNILITASKNAERIKKIDNRYKIIFKDLNLHSNIQNVLPEKGARDNTIKYFEAIKELESCRYNPFYWLQYAIATMSFNEFEQAEVYFNNAKAIIRNRPYFDSHQIDNHYARFLIQSVIYNNDHNKAMDNFKKAHHILNMQMSSEFDIVYPYRYAKFYLNFYNHFKKILSKDEKKYIKKCCLDILKKINSNRNKIKDHRGYVNECQKNMNNIIMQYQKEYGEE